MSSLCHLNVTIVHQQNLKKNHHATCHFHAKLPSHNDVFSPSATATHLSTCLENLRQRNPYDFYFSQCLEKKQRQFAVDVQEWVYSCHLNLEPKKFLQLFEFSSQAQVTANESEELPQSFFRSGDNVRSGLWCPVVSTRMHAIGLSQHGCMPSDWRCHMFKEMWNGSVTFPPSLL